MFLLIFRFLFCLQVIDSSDSLRMIVIKEELDLLLKHDQLASNPYLPILFCANKMDLKDALYSLKIVEHLGLNQIGERPWHIQVGAFVSWMNSKSHQLNAAFFSPLSTVNKRPERRRADGEPTVACGSAGSNQKMRERLLRSFISLPKRDSSILLDNSKIIRCNQTM